MYIWITGSLPKSGLGKVVKSNMSKMEDACSSCGEKAQDDLVRLQQDLFSFLVAARPSIQRATYHWQRHRQEGKSFMGGYSSRLEVDALMFLTSENQQFEFRTLNILKAARPGRRLGYCETALRYLGLYYTHKACYYLSS
jgi:hypothetical protein